MTAEPNAAWERSSFTYTNDQISRMVRLLVLNHNSIAKAYDILVSDKLFSASVLGNGVPVVHMLEQFCRIISGERGVLHPDAEALVLQSIKT